MHVTRLVSAEIWGRPLNFLLSLMVIVVASILFVTGPTLINGYAADTKQQLSELQAETDRVLEEMQRETDARLAEMDDRTRVIMRDLGVNLRIVHRDTSMGNFYTDFVAVDFPESYVEKLANAPSIETIVHLVATLQEKVKWNGRTALLVGMRPVLTASQKNAERKHMVQPVEAGTIVVGYELATGLQGEALQQADTNGNGRLDVGDQLDVLGTTFRVAEVRPEAGELQDIQLVLELHDAQKLVHKDGRIHQIMALNCKCQGNRISVIRRELEGVLPDTKVTEHLSRATAREQQRDIVAKTYQAQMQAEREKRESQMALVQANRERWEKALSGLVTVMLPLVVFVAALIVGLMTWLNVRERRSEIGLLRALGKRSGEIAAMFLLKAAFLGVLGGLFGSLVCWLIFAAVAATIDAEAAEFTVAFFRPSWWLLALTMLGAPLVTAMASYLPTLTAISQDPAIVLMDN
jgi:putative ABC transport system permease protein